MAAELPVTDDDMIAGMRSEYERLSSTAEGPQACFRSALLRHGVFALVLLPRCARVVST